MCGIFGFIQSGDGKGPTVASLKAMAKAAESRGRHAFGISWVDAAGRIHCYKQAGAIGNHLDVLNLCTGAVAVIGHTRWATHGSVEDNTNNHPHPVDGGWLVHNGIITNYSELVRKHRLLMQSRCDSEVLGLMIEKFKGSVMARVQRTVSEVSSEAPFAMAAIWSRPSRLVLVRRGNPVYIGRGRTGNVYFCSCESGLPGVVKPMDDNTVFQYDIKSGAMQTREVAARRVVQGRVYEGSTTFTQGAGCGIDRPVKGGTFPQWRDELEPLNGDSQFDDEDDCTDEEFIEYEPNPTEPEAVHAAVEAQAKAEKARRAKLSTHQRRALDLLERASGDKVNTAKPYIDPMARFHELKEKGTINGVPLKGGVA